jgi:hypothetical protein
VGDAAARDAASDEEAGEGAGPEDEDEDEDEDEVFMV